MDGVCGQVISVDEGTSLMSPICYYRMGRGVPHPFNRDAGREEG
jgi:hypothetical protein